MEQFPILVILPYEGLINTFQSLQKDFPQAEMTYIGRDPGKVSEQIAKLKRKYPFFAVIVSDGYTCPDCLDGLPIVRMHIGFSDILYSLKSAARISGKHAMVTHGLPNKELVSDNVANIGAIIGYTVDLFGPDDADDLDALICKLKALNYRAVIGSARVTEAAQKAGVSFIQIPYGAESVRDAVEKAVLICQISRATAEKYQIYNSVLNEISDYILLETPEGETVYSNAAKKPDEFNQLMQKLQQEMEAISFGSFEIENKNVIWSVTRKRMQPGGQYIVTLLRRSRFVDATNGGSIKYVTKPDSRTIANIYRSTDFANVRALIEKYVDCNGAVLITGERGMGKGNIAFLLNHENNMIRIECNHLTLEGFHAFLDNGYQQMVKDSVTAVLLANIDVLSPDIQELMADFLTLVKEQGHVRILSTAWDELYRKVSRGDFSIRLYQLLGEICIDIPPLRSLVGDLDEELPFIISLLNIELGTQVVGISREAMDSLKSFEWSTNLQQLLDVLRRSMRAADTPYITDEDVTHMLSMERNLWSKSRGAAAFWRGSLEDIERRIIRGILEEEDMNQARTAKRLGISRSTLWRKLK